MNMNEIYAAVLVLSKEKQVCYECESFVGSNRL